MKKGKDIAWKFPGLFLVHQNIPGKVVDFHQHDDHHLFIPIAGEIHVEIEGHVFQASPGKMIYLTSETLHKFDSSSCVQGERLICQIDHKLFGKQNLKNGTYPQSQLIKEILFYLLLNPKTKNVKSLVSVLIETLIELLTNSEEGFQGEHLDGMVTDERLKTSLKILEANFAKPFSMNELAKKSGLSTRSLNRLFMESLGKTPKQIQTNFRIQQAKNLLQTGTSVTHVAYEVGYESLSTFISNFRHLTGVLPSDYGQKPH